MKRVLAMKRILLATACLLMCKAGFGQDTTTLSGTITLDQCISIAIKNNLQVNESGFTSATAGVNLEQARGNFLPTASLNINHSLSEGRVINSVDNSYSTQSSTFANYNLNIGYTLWNAGSIRNYVASNKYNYEATKMDLQQQKDNITINVILQYIQILSLEEQLNASKQQVESFKQQVNKTDIQNQEGAVTNPASLSDLKASLAQSELNVINSEKGLETAKIQLASYLNLKYSKNFELQKLDESITPAYYDTPSDIIYQQGLNSLAYIKAGHLRTLSAAKNLQSAKGQMWPTISFGASASSNANSLARSTTNTKVPYTTQLGNNFGSSFGVGIYVPILNNFQLRSATRRARITLERSKFEEITNKTTLQQNIEQAYLNMTTGFASYQKYQELAKDYSESARIAQVRFNEGVTTSVEYIVTKTNFDNATLNLIATKYDYILRTKILDYYQGKIKGN